MKERNKLRLHRKKRTSSKIIGTEKNPRMIVFRSNKNIYIQFVDDIKGKIVLGIDSRKIGGKTFDVKKAQELGKLAAKEIMEKKIKSVVLDRSGYKYHGKLKAIAEGAREAGLKF